MGFPKNWGQAASLRLTAMARGTVQHAVEAGSGRAGAAGGQAPTITCSTCGRGQPG